MNTKPVSLLIVDDDPVSALFVQQLVLTLEGELSCSVRCVDTPEKAMGELARVAYDLVLLDYHLPGADGLQVLASIRTLPAGTQPAVIMLTGSGNESVAVEAMKRGASDYLTKNALEVAPLLRALRSALAQKQLADQVSRHDAERRADLEMARNLQQSLLPGHYPCFPASASREESALKFCHRFLPASELAGDFFSVLALSDSVAGVFICDVMGHGVRSALVTAMVRALVDDASGCATDPSEFLGRINRRLAGLLKSVETPLFATAYYMTVDAGQGRLRCASAGHPAPFHLQAAPRKVVLLPSAPHPGPALGLFPDAAFPSAECLLAPGDVILLFTDGLFEVTNVNGSEEYGRERLLASAERHIRLPPDELCDVLIAEARAFSGDAELEDDVCLLCVEAARAQRSGA
jgi:sigma-B regulation protein RsbU (phosphoserine phosphatase)